MSRERQSLLGRLVSLECLFQIPIQSFNYLHKDLLLKKGAVNSSLFMAFLDFLPQKSSRQDRPKSQSMFQFFS